MFSASFIYAQDSGQTTKSPTKVGEIKCVFSDKEVLRLGHLPQNVVEKKIDPTYPQTARDANIEGKVVLTVLIDRKGKVVETCVEDGNPLLVPSAIEAVKQWKFKKHFGFSAKSFKSKKYVQTSIAITFRITEKEGSEN